jgi:hypothetical protein
MKSRLLVVVVGLGALLAGIGIGRSLGPRTAKPEKKDSAQIQPNLTSLEKRAETPVPEKAAARPAELSVKSSPRDLISQLKEALAHFGSPRAFARLSNLIDSIDLDHMREVLNFAQNLKPQDRGSLVPLVIARWAELNPADALAYAQHLTNAGERIRAVNSAVSGWAENDLDAALAWTQRLPQTPMRDQAMQAVVTAMADKDPQAALNLVQSMPGKGRQSMLYWAIFNRWAERRCRRGESSEFAAARFGRLELAVASA